MKKCNLFTLVLMFVALLCYTSCTNSKVGGLLDKVPAESQLVAVGNLRTIIESAGGEIDGSTIKLPKSISDLMPSRESDQFEEINDFLKSAAINVDACALVIEKFSEAQPVIIFGIDDTKKFIKAIEDEDFDENDKEDGIVFYRKKTHDSSYYTEYAYIAIDGDYGYFIPGVSKDGSYKPDRAIKKMIEAAKDDSFIDTEFGKYISEGNAGGLAVRIPKELKREFKSLGIPASMASIFDGVICMKCDLDKNKAIVETKMLDSDGKQLNIEEFGDFFDINAKVDKNALAYLGENEQLVYAVALKDVNWSKYLKNISGSGMLSRSDQQILDEVSTYLKQIDGTVALGMGITNGLESIVSIDRGKDMMSNMSFTLVVSTKKDKAPSLLKNIKGLLDDAQFPYEKTSNGIKIGDSDLTIYINAENDYLIASNHKINSSATNKTVNTINLDNYIGGVGLVLTKNDKLIKDIDINNGIVASILCDTKKTSAIMECEITGDGPDGFLARLIKVCTDIYDNSRSIENKVEKLYDKYRTYNHYDDYDYYDYDEDSTVVVEEAYDYYE